MGENLDGKLTFNKKRQRFLQFTTAKGSPMSLIPSPDVFSAKVKESKEAELPVKVDTGPDGRPTAIYIEGETVIVKKQTVQADYSRTNPIPDSERSRFGAGRDSRSEREFRSGETRGVSTPMTPEFHNPYNFVPTPPRVQSGELGDHEPAGHDRYCPDRYSGTLRVKMTIATPLVLPDTARMVYTNAKDRGITDHKSYPVRVRPLLDDQGDPVIKDEKNVLVPDINPTAVKGMLRSAYEAITNSRFSVFKDHDQRLAYRGEAKIRFAARIELHKGSLHIRRFNKFPAVMVRYRKHWNGEKDKLERDNPSKRPVETGRAMKYSGSSNLPEHGQAVWVKISNRVSHGGRAAGRRIGEKVDEIRVRTGGVAPTGFVPGWVCVTGANTKEKVYERVFIESTTDRHIPLTKAHEKMWEELIANYQKTHEEDLKKRRIRGDKATDYLGDEPGKTAFSIQVHDRNYSKLENGTLCYLIEENGVIQAIIPVIISRQLYEVPPDSILPDYLKPVSLIEHVRNSKGDTIRSSEMSPADRVFGCIRQKRKLKDSKDLSSSGNVPAYRGQVRIGPLTCRGRNDETQGANSLDVIELFGDEGNADTWLPLSILGQPKPQQGRFYLAKNKQCDAQDPGLSNIQAGYNSSRFLRGRKVYPHHNLPSGTETEYWRNTKSVELKVDPPKNYSREFRRPQKYSKETKQFEDQRDSQNRSIGGWAKPQTEFGFEIHFVNLSITELGAFIWLLTLTEGYHRLGGGKPLGFGSVKLELDEDGSEILTGREVRKRYLSLSVEETQEKSKPTTASDCQVAFETTMSSYPNGKLILDSFIAAAKGFDKPIHYPRLEPKPNPEGKSFEWFVANNSNAGFKLALGDLDQDPGLPLRPKS